MPVISSYNGIYILQFDSIESAQIAYSQLANTVEFIEVDTGILVDEESSDEIIVTDTIMTEEENPFEELKDAIKNESSNISYDIALIDTGADLSANVVSAVSMLGDDASDDNGHGSRMVSYILEQNPDARILSIKAFDANGKADISAVYAAFEYAISQNVKIINLSASAIATQDNSIVAEVIRKAIANGIIVVGSAGNNGNNVAYYIPGNIEEAYIIGACNADGERLSSSNYGATVDYNVVADSTSEAAARFSGYVSKNGLEKIASADIFSTTKMENPSADINLHDVWINSKDRDFIERVQELCAYGMTQEDADILINAFYDNQLHINTAVTKIYKKYNLFNDDGMFSIDYDPFIYASNEVTGIYVTSEGMSGMESFYELTLGGNVANAPIKGLTDFSGSTSSGVTWSVGNWQYLVAGPTTQLKAGDVYVRNGGASGEYYNNHVGIIIEDGYPTSISTANGNPAIINTRNLINGLNAAGNPLIIRHKDPDVQAGIAQSAIDVYNNEGSIMSSYYESSDNLWGTPINWCYSFVWRVLLKAEKLETSKYVQFGKTVSNNNGSFRVTKSVSSDISTDTNKEWTFTLSRTPAENYTVTVYNANGTTATAAKTISSNGGTFKLKSGQYADITGVPQGRQVKVTETADSLFNTKVGSAETREHTFTIPSNPASSYTFTVTGLPSGSFDYYVFSSSPSSTKTGTIANNGTVSLKAGEKCRIVGLPANQAVTATETAPSSTGGSWSYDPTSRKVSGNANDNSIGTVENTFTPTRQSATWTNIRKKGNISAAKTVSTPTGSVKITKTVDSIVTSDHTKSWEFTLTAKNGNTSVTTDTYKITIYNSNGSVATAQTNISSNSGKFYLKKDQYAVISGIPQGRTITATETYYPSSINEKMYTVTVGGTETRDVTFIIPSNNVTNYTFTVTGLPTGKSYDYYTYSSSGSRPATKTGTISNNGTITLQNNQKFDILGLPAGIDVSITESAPTAITGATWSTTNSNNGSSGYTWTVMQRINFSSGCNFAAF